MKTMMVQVSFGHVGLDPVLVQPVLSGLLSWGAKQKLVDTTLTLRLAKLVPATDR
jgi:hypothetical protein